MAGLFGHELFTPYVSATYQPSNDFLIVTEGEFNVLQLQSLTVRFDEQATGESLGYLNAVAVGSVMSVDVGTLERSAPHPVIIYDHDANEAGFELVKRVQKAVPVEACTTPWTWGTKSDLDSYIREFDQDYVAAWEAVKTLLGSRKPYGRVYAGTGEEFFAYPVEGKTKVFIPRLLGEALLARQTYRYTASQLWVYRDGVYLPCGEATIHQEAQTLLGNERRVDRINEALSYVEVATRFEDDRLFR
jgi:hypothetical protein